MQSRNLVALLFAAALLAACNLGVQAPHPQTDQNAIETVVEQTLQAAAVTPFTSPVPPPSSTPSTPAAPASATVAASPSPTPTATKPGDKPMLEIIGNSNCRSGPGASFKNVTAFTPGAKLEIIGKNTENNYWQVKLPGSQDTCWVWGVYTTMSGNVDSVPETTPIVPTAVAVAPAQPGALFYQWECANTYSVSVSLKWSDRADNETGYRVYRGDSVIADLPAGSTTYADTVMLAPPQALVYTVVAYNDHGESAPSRASFTACP